MDEDERAVVQRELALLDPAVRRDADRVRAHMHPNFREVGASGRLWDRTSISSVTSGTDEPIRATGLATRRLGPDAVLLTYVSDVDDRRVHRSSVWVRDVSGDWLLLHHQGTLAG